MLKKALIVDDDPLIRNLIGGLLRRKGFLLAEAANGEEALTLLSSSRSDQDGQTEFDLILVDLMMPKVSGWDVLSYIEQSLPEAAKNVVVISAAGEKQLRELERRGTCGVILPKPFDTEAFYQKIASCIRGPYDPSQFDPGSEPGSTSEVL